jgi:hypothetical protein
MRNKKLHNDIIVIASPGDTIDQVSMTAIKLMEYTTGNIYITHNGGLYHVVIYTNIASLRDIVELGGK